MQPYAGKAYSQLYAWKTYVFQAYSWLYALPA